MRPIRKRVLVATPVFRSSPPCPKVRCAVLPMSPDPLRVRVNKVFNGLLSIRR